MDHIKEIGERPAIIDSTGEYSYDELGEQVSSYINDIEREIVSENIIGILSDYNFYAIALFLALVEQKKIIVPIVSKIEEEISRRLEISSCDKVITFNKMGQLCVKPSAEGKKHDLVSRLIAQDRSGLILFSSGSTGEPKAMVHDLDNLIDSYRGKKLKKLNMMVFLMFDHIGGINTLLNTLSLGAQIILPSSRDPEDVASLIERHHVNVLPTSPTFLNMMLMANVGEKYNLSSLRMITYGTEPMPESLLLRLRKVFKKARFLQTFGTSETGIAKTSSRSSDSLEMKFEDPDQEYKVVEGELWLRSKTQVLGYLNASMESFTKDGWFRTGDLVEELEGGYIRIVGRNKEVINVGGEKVLPAEVESVLLEIDIVADALVRGESNAIMGQSVVADIVLSVEVEKKDAKKQIKKYCRERLAGYKVPIKLTFLKLIDVGGRFKKIRLKNIKE